MLAAIDIHKAVFQAVVLDPGDGAVVEERFKASREALLAWAQKWDGKLDAREMLPQSWLAPEEIQRLRDKTRAEAMSREELDAFLLGVDAADAVRDEKQLDR
jgi:hypothetical protein